MQSNERSIIGFGVFKYARVVVFLKMTERTRLKLFQKPTKAYTEAHKEKNGKDVHMEVSQKWKEIEGFGFRTRRQ